MVAIWKESRKTKLPQFVLAVIAKGPRPSRKWNYSSHDADELEGGANPNPRGVLQCDLDEGVRLQGVFSQEIRFMQGVTFKSA